MAEVLELLQPKELAPFAVLGAGNGGQAMAGFLALRSFPVNLWNRPGLTISKIKDVGGISLEGHINGYSVPNMVTGDIEAAIDGVKVIMVTVPASGHRDVAHAMAPFVQDGQIIVLNPGRTGGALEFNQILRSMGNKNDYTVAEAGTFIYASRTLEPGRSKIFGIKRRVSLAALPATRTMEVTRILRNAYPQFTPVESVLTTSFDNMGAIFHPTPVLLNSGRIESGKPFEHYREGITPSVALVLEELDKERVAVGRAYGASVRSAKEWLKDTYGVESEDLFSSIQKTEAYQGILAPKTLSTRYLYEDVPFSLVPMVSLGKRAGIKMPVMESVVNLSSRLTGVSFRKTGRTAKDMGFHAGKPAQFSKFVMEGA